MLRGKHGNIKNLRRKFAERFGYPCALSDKEIQAISQNASSVQSALLRMHGEDGAKTQASNKRDLRKPTKRADALAPSPIPRSYELPLVRVDNGIAQYSARARVPSADTTTPFIHLDISTEVFDSCIPTTFTFELKTTPR